LESYYFTAPNIQAQPDLNSSEALLTRIIPKQVNRFIIQKIPAEKDKDVFEIETVNNKIVLRGNDGVAVASALYYYLNEYCHAQITWNGTNLTVAAYTTIAQ